MNGMGNIPVLQQPNRYAGIVGFLQNWLGGMQQQQIQQQQQQDMIKFINQIKSGGAITNLPTEPEAQKEVLQFAGQYLHPTQARLYEAETEKTRAETKMLGQPDVSKIQTTATGLRKEFQDSPIYKNYLVVQDSASKMQAAYDESVTNPSTKSRVASDQALAVLFQKMLDPTSVVRESEYARTPEGISALNYIQAWIPKLKQGGLQVTDEDRKAIYNMAQKLLTVSKETMNRHIAGYTGLAEKYGVEPSLVLGDMKKFELGEENGLNKTPTSYFRYGSQTQQQGLTATNPTTGEKIQSFDGGRTWQPIK